MHHMPLAARLILTVLLAGLLVGPARAAAESCFPLGPGMTWKYKVTGKTAGQEDGAYFQTLATAEPIDAAGQKLAPLGEDLYQVRDDGTYLCGRRSANRIQVFDPPQRLLPLQLRTGDSWSCAAGPRSTLSTCLGARAIETPAGKFQAQCIYRSTSDSNDAKFQQQVYAFYAPGVGLVREVLTEETIDADGLSHKTERTRELVAFDNAAAQPATRPAEAKPIGAESVRGLLFDPEGQPVAQARVTLRRLDMPQSSTVQTDLAGAFAATQLDPAGTYALSVHVGGYRPVELPLHSEDGSVVKVQVRLERQETPATRPGAEWNDSPVRPVYLSAGPDTAPAGDPPLEEGWALAQQGKHAEAVDCYKRALAADPKNALAHERMAISLLALNQPDAAEKHLAEAQQIDPGRYLPYQLRGQIQIGRGKIEEGRALYEKAAALAPASAGVVYADLAAALTARNDSDLAGAIESALKAAASAQPPHLDSLFNLGQAYATAGKQAGRPYLQRYLDEQTRLPEAQRNVTRMKLARQMIRALDAIRQ